MYTRFVTKYVVIYYSLYCMHTVQTNQQAKLFKFAVLFIVHHCILNMRMLLEKEWFACMCNICQSCNPYVTRNQKECMSHNIYDNIWHCSIYSYTMHLNIHIFCNIFKKISLCIYVEQYSMEQESKNM